MFRHVSITSIVGSLIALGMVCTVSAQQPARAALPLFLDVNWEQPASQTGQVPVVQDNIGDPNLELKQYGLHANCLLTSGNPGSDTTPFSAWSGACESPFATMFRHKTNYVDLTGTSRIRWAVKNHVSQFQVYGRAVPRTTSISSR